MYATSQLDGEGTAAVQRNIERLERRLLLDRLDQDVTLELAVLYARSALREQARQLLRTFLEHAPEPSMAKALLGELGLGGWESYRGGPGRSGCAFGRGLRTAPRARWSWQARRPGSTLVGPAVSDGRRVLVVTAEDNRVAGFEPYMSVLACLELETGELLWELEQQCIPALPVVAGDAAIWGWLAPGPGGMRHELMSLDLDTGAPRWRCEAKAARGYSPYDASPLLLADGLVFAASNGYRPGFRADGGFFVVCDAASGELVEQFALAGARTPVAAAGGVYFYDDEGAFRRYSHGEGLALRVEGSSPYPAMSVPVAAAAAVSCVVAVEHETRLLRISERGAEVQWRRFGPGGTVAHAPVLGANDTLLVASAAERVRDDVVSFQGFITELDPATGEVLRERSHPWRPTTSPTLVGEVLYVCAELSPFIQRQLGAPIPSNPFGFLERIEGLAPPTSPRAGHAEAAPACLLTALDVTRGFEALWAVALPDYGSAAIEAIPAGDLLLLQHGQGRVVALGA